MILGTSCEFLELYHLVKHAFAETVRAMVQIPAGKTSSAFMLTDQMPPPWSLKELKMHEVTSYDLRKQLRPLGGSEKLLTAAGGPSYE